MNHRHTDFQSVALPTELSGQIQAVLTLESKRVIGKPPRAVYLKRIENSVFFIGVISR